MKKIYTLLLILGFATLGFAATITTDGEDDPCEKSKLKSIETNGKVVLCLNGINTDGLLLKVFSPNGLLIENTKLKGANASYEMDKPEKGIYWVSLKKDATAKFERLIIN